jgi:hypothetical protein
LTYLDRETAIIRIANQIRNTLTESPYIAKITQEMLTVIKNGLNSLTFKELKDLFYFYDLQTEEFDGHFVDYEIERF